MAWRFHAIDATLSPSPRLLDGVEVHEGLHNSHQDNLTHWLISTQVWDLQPDVNHKHWPTGSPREMARAARAAATVELRPGDALYVPLMWPHSVQSADASVTSNTYLYRAEGWADYVDRAKEGAWMVYELERGGLC